MVVDCIATTFLQHTTSNMAETNNPLQHQRDNVQDVASKAEQVPEIYIRRNECDQGSLDAPLLEAPVIDICLLSSSSELDKLRHGLQSWGCFRAINHGVCGEFLEQVREVAKQFFDLKDMAEMIKYG